MVKLIAAVHRLRSSLFAFFVDLGVFAVVDADFFDEGFEIILMRARGRVVVVFGNAGGQLDDDFVFVNALFLFERAFEERELAVQCPAAASAAGEVDHAVVFIRRVIGKPAGAFMKRLFAQIAGAAFFDNMTLNNDDVFFF